MTTAVVLYNLGGPDKPESIRPFLFNLFNDPKIIGAPAPIRWAIAWLISRLREPKAREIYAFLGGASPLLENTRAQAGALERILNADAPGAFRCFVAMRYWHPMCEAAMDEVIASGPDRIVLLPLYPQFSTTTVGSMMRVWNLVAARRGMDVPVAALCCYPTDPGFVSAVAGAIKDALDALPKNEPVRILFSAHGLPRRIVERGDPYQWQVERTADAVVDALGDVPDWLCCYQSRVGPLEWIGPSTEEEIARAGAEGTSVLVAPIAFVSDHSETLVELDIEYRELAERAGVPNYVRVPVAGTAAPFIEGLADMVRAGVARGAGVCTGAGGRYCPADRPQCPARPGGQPR